MDQQGPSTSPNNPSEEPVAPEQNRAESTPAGQQEPAASGPKLGPADIGRQQALHTQTVYPDENQQLRPGAPDAPRLWDFPLLRLPIPELVIGGIMILSVLGLSGSDNPGAGLFVLFIFVPSFAFYLGMYALTIPLHFRPVNEFWGDLIALAPGVFGLLIVAKGGEGIFFMATLPIAISLLLRRLIAYSRWKRGNGPMGFPPPEPVNTMY